MRKGFTLVELLVVIAILVILMAVLVASFRTAPMKAEIAKCQELVNQTKTAMEKLVIGSSTASWPKALINNNMNKKGLDAKAAYPLRNIMDLSNDGTSSLTKLDRFGIVTPWAEAVIREQGTACTESTEVPLGGTIADHRLFYALDLQLQGKIQSVNVNATVPDLTDVDTVDIRGYVAVWCRGPRGEYIRSWSLGDTQGVK